MEAGQKNPITIRLIDEISSIYKVTVRQDGSKMADQWHLNKIELVGKDPKTGDILPGEKPIDFFQEKNYSLNLENIFRSKRFRL